MDSLTLPVSEVFGPVWQGEGPHAGRRCWFLRLGHCNLSCSWCDTPFTWDATRYPLEFDNQSAAQVAAALAPAQLVVISGGEPLMHQGRAAFVELLRAPHEWHVETNGTIAPNDAALAYVDHWSVSPKLGNQGDSERKRLKPKALAAFAELARGGAACWKFVATSPLDVDAAAQLAEHYGVPAWAVWIMPEGTTALEVLSGARLLADRVAGHGFNLTLRQQVLMYGQERAR